MGQRDIRRLLITGTMVIVRWACRKGAQEGTWLHRMLGRKPRMLVAIALANKMARSIWAMLTKGEDYSRSCGSDPLIHDQVGGQGNVGRVRRSRNGKGK